MRIGLQNTDWVYVGAKLAQADDNEQATFFKGYLAECNSWGTFHQVQIQMAAVNILLSEDEKKQLSMLTHWEY